MARTLLRHHFPSARTLFSAGVPFPGDYPFPLPKAGSLSFMDKYMNGNKAMHLFFVEMANFYAFSSLYGEEMAGRLLALAMETLDQVMHSLCADRHMSIEAIAPGQFMILCQASGQSPDALPDLAITLRRQLKSGLKGPSLKLIGQDFDILAGYAVVSRNGRSEPEAVLYNALCDAQRTARGDMEGIKPGVLSEFREILAGRQLTTLYQPIVDLKNGDILAWEALTRGPEGSLFRSPINLFDFAEEIGEIFTLEKACRESAIRNFGEFKQGSKLFLNIHPRTLVDPGFSPGETLRLLSGCGLSPENIVFEITERHAIRDFTTFHHTLEHYRGQGYKIAVDDVGTGYSGLWSIAELRPDYLKIDMSFIRGIDSNPIKRALLETFVSFSEKIGCKVIAEGIETSTELSSLIAMGAHYGQGYHLARPANPKPELRLKTPAWQMGSTRQVMEAKCSIPIRDLATRAYSMSPTDSVCDAKQIITGEEPISALVITEDEKPVGLVMSHHLDRALSSQYGMSLYYHRSVSRIMDASPLIVDS